MFGPRFAARFAWYSQEFLFSVRSQLPNLVLLLRNCLNAQSLKPKQSVRAKVCLECYRLVVLFTWPYPAGAMPATAITIQHRHSIYLSRPNGSK